MDLRNHTIRAGGLALQTWADLPSPLRRKIFAVLILFLALLLSFVVWKSMPAAAPELPPSAESRADAPPAFLAVCSKCDTRTAYEQRPEMRNGAAICRNCRAATAAIFRYGAQVIPPGGWSLEVAPIDSENEEGDE